MEQARQWSERALLLAREAAHAYTLAYTLVLSSWFHHFRREWAVAQERAEEAIAICYQTGTCVVAGVGNDHARLGARNSRGKEAGIAQIRQGLAAAQATGAGVFRTYQLTLLAEAYQTVGEPAAGLAALDEALALVEKTERAFLGSRNLSAQGRAVAQG